MKKSHRSARSKTYRLEKCSLGYDELEEEEEYLPELDVEQAIVSTNTYEAGSKSIKPAI